MSGKDTNRPALTELLAYVREGDRVRVASLDRLVEAADSLDLSAVEEFAVTTFLGSMNMTL